MTDLLGRLGTALADRYRIERELGQGGMATVYLAHDVRHDRKVALKVLRPELSAILGGERFLAEIKTTANLQHPHILSLFDSGEADGTVFYVMPYVDGESLRDRMNREKQLPVEEAVRIAREVADALHYAHQHGIVHRDIKPENILLHGGHALVADFGIALAASRSDGGTRMTETGMSLGTPHYMSPEQAMGEKDITAKADIYALGCVLYEMLTAEPPFTGATAQAIIARVMTEEPRSLTMQRRTIPPHVEAAVRTALEKLPADRFASAAQFAEALGRADYSAPASTRTGMPKVPRARASVRRYLPWLFTAAALAALALTLLQREPPPVTRQRIVLWQWPLNSGGFSRIAAMSPDGRTIVYVDTVGGTRQLWAKERDRLEATPLAGTSAQLVWGPAFSPDGQWIAFAADGQLKKVPRLGGSAIVLSDSMNMLYASIAWLDNGSIAYNAPDFSLNVIPEDGGPARTVFPALTNGRGVASATPLPGGRGVLIGVCTGGCSDIDLRVVDLERDTTKILADEVVKAWHTGDGHVVFARQDGGVFRVPFDLDELGFRAAPVPVMQGVRTIPGRADMLVGASGTLLYVAGSADVGGEPADAMWVTRDGVATPVDPSWNSLVPSANFGLALSPDGRRLAISLRAGGSQDIWIKELPAGPLTRLTFAGSNIRPEWTADGRSVMYLTDGELRRRRADGTGGEDTLLKAPRAIFEVRRTRDTSTLIIRYTTPPTRDIHLFHPGRDTASVPLLASNAEESTPIVSPDGRWLAYTSNESGRGEVYVRPFPNVNDGRWQVSANGGQEPRWAPGGRELLYRRGDIMVSVAVTPGAGFTMGQQRTLFQGSFLPGANHQVWDLTPDGRRFLFLRTRGGGPVAARLPQQVIQVEHWVAELGRGRPSP